MTLFIEAIICQNNRDKGLGDWLCLYFSGGGDDQRFSLSGASKEESLTSMRRHECRIVFMDVSGKRGMAQTVHGRRDCNLYSPVS